MVEIEDIGDAVEDSCDLDTDDDLIESVKVTAKTCLYCKKGSTNPTGDRSG